eukprot:TRINITY_DN1575_c2_g1_i1.p1 TRINITY_DN1575_c2_g1~~TRINITY_DN1575_c2_g1_i1.p1  ORF type:complete len:694 (+),score=197.83 TRINITY_DN1575_c2_g1_i1:138-2219(+)
MSEAKRNVLFVPFKPVIDVQFWLELHRKKLEEWKLDERPRPSSASFATSSYTLTSSFSVPVFLNKESVDSTQDGPRMKGTIALLNVQSDLHAIRKSSILAEEWSHIRSEWMEMDLKTRWNHLEFLVPFLFRGYADLKKHTFEYYFASPTPILRPPLLEQCCVYSTSSSTATQTAILQCKQIEREYSFEDVKEKIDAFIESLGEAVPWLFVVACRCANSDCVDVGPDGLVCLTLSDLCEEEERKSICSWVLIFLDPSAHERAFGWPLRNALWLLFADHPLFRNQTSINVASWRRNDLTSSFIITIRTPAVSDLEASKEKMAGWLTSQDGKLRAHVIDMHHMMDEGSRLRSSLMLNLQLMKWRQFPGLRLDVLREAKCLIIGAGTLGCNVSRVLLGWGVEHMTFVDNGKVSASNPVRQSLYTLSDEGSFKSEAAARAIERIYPTCHATAVVLTIPMPGHVISRKEEEEKTFEESVHRLDHLIKNHDVVFLLTDSRESRWLPTLMASASRTLLINAALGFDTYVVMRHLSIERTSSLTSKREKGKSLGCYFCSDVSAPRDTLSDRTMDMQCTVTRSGDSYIAAALAVEMWVATIHESQKEGEEGRKMGSVPQQIRGYLNGFEQLALHQDGFDRCLACGDEIRRKYEEDPISLVRNVCNDPSILEEISGLQDVDVDGEIEAMEKLEMTDDDDDFELI